MSCSSCDKAYSTKSNLNKHIRQAHKTATSAPKYSCDDCSEKFFTLNELKTHSISKHDFRPSYEQHHFPTISDFHSWKEQVEKDSCSRFVATSGASEKKKVTYLSCHRSGEFSSEGKGLRKLKKQGSVKAGCRCFASMTVREKETGVSVLFQTTHKGHDFLLKHTLLTPTERAAIAAKLQQGVSLDAVLDGVRESLDKTLQRKHLLVRQDLCNIMRDFDLSHSERLHSNDHTSVLLWVESMKKNDDNPVLFFKHQGQADNAEMLNREECEKLENSDFMLAIMTKPQEELLKKLGTDRICIDGTHGTTGCDFQLVTLLCVDEFGAGFPVAYCITNRVDRKAMLAFLKAIKVRTGQVAANAFMSDDAPAFFNAWKDVMGEPKHRLLCAWHVDKNWRENIKRHIRDANLQAFTYKALRTVLDSPNEDSFKDSLASFFAWCDLEGQNEEGLIKFKEYFRQHYANRPETWAACFRRNAGINTNMRLEALHKLLKYCYLDGQQNKRVDKLISVLLKLTRNKIFDRLIKLIKNAETESQRKVTERHNGGLKIAASRVSSAGIGQWTVQSQSQPATMYVVTSQSGGMCQESCSFACPICRVCAHNTTCSCPDNELRRNLCKHIHAVFINKMNNTDEGQQPVEEDMQGCQPDLPTSQATPAAAPPLPKVASLQDMTQEEECVEVFYVPAAPPTDSSTQSPEASGDLVLCISPSPSPSPEKSGESREVSPGPSAHTEDSDAATPPSHGRSPEREETPEKAFLRCEVTRYSILYRGAKKKIKTLQQCRRRLTSRVAHLQDEVKELKARVLDAELKAS